eukprot:3840955-Rhodomonas_salina.1
MGGDASLSVFLHRLHHHYHHQAGRCQSHHYSLLLRLLFPRKGEYNRDGQAEPESTKETGERALTKRTRISAAPNANNTRLPEGRTACEQWEGTVRRERGARTLSHVTLQLHMDDYWKDFQYQCPICTTLLARVCTAELVPRYRTPGCKHPESAAKMAGSGVENELELSLDEHQPLTYWDGKKAYFPRSTSVEALTNEEDPK